LEWRQSEQSSGLKVEVVAHNAFVNALNKSIPTLFRNARVTDGRRRMSQLFKSYVKNLKVYPDLSRFYVGLHQIIRLKIILQLTKITFQCGWKRVSGLALPEAVLSSI
jgi:hypothetical protein